MQEAKSTNNQQTDNSQKSSMAADLQEDFKMEGAAYKDNEDMDMDMGGEDAEEQDVFFEDENMYGKSRNQNPFTGQSSESKESDMQRTGSNLDKYATKRIRSLRHDSKQSQNADMKGFITVDPKNNSGSSNTSNKNKSKIYFNRKKTSTFKKQTHTPNESIDMVTEPQIIKVQKQSENRQRETMLPKLKLDNILTTTINHKMYQTSPHAFQQIATPTIRGTQKQHYHHLLLSPQVSDTAGGAGISGKYDEDGSQQRQVYINQPTDTIYETSELYKQRGNLPIDNYSINDIESAFLNNSAVDTQAYGQTPIYLTNQGLKHIHVENKNVQASPHTPKSIQEEMMRLHMEISSRQYESILENGRRLISNLGNHPAAFQSLLPNPNLCPVRVLRRESSFNKKRKVKIVGVPTQIGKEMAKRKNVDQYWQQIKPTLYNNEIKIRMPDDNSGSKGNIKSPRPKSPKAGSKEKLQAVTSGKHGHKIIEDTIYNEHPISSQYYFQSSPEESTFPTTVISGNILTNERLSREMRRRQFSKNQNENSKGSKGSINNQDQVKVIGKLDKIDIKFRKNYNSKDKFKEEEISTAMIAASPSSNIESVKHKKPNRKERYSNSSSSSSSGRVAHFPIVKKQIHEFLPDENINYSQLERNKQLIKAGLFSKAERITGSGRKLPEQSSLSPQESVLTNHLSKNELAANGYGVKTMIHSTLDPTFLAPTCSSKEIQQKPQLTVRINSKSKKQNRYASLNRQPIYKKTQPNTNLMNELLNNDHWHINSKMPDRFQVKKMPPNHNIQQLILTQSELLQKNKTILGPLGKQSPQRLHARKTVIKPPSPPPPATNLITIKSLYNSKQLSPSENTDRSAHAANATASTTTKPFTCKRNTISHLNADMNQFEVEPPSLTTTFHRDKQTLSNEFRDNFLRLNINQIQLEDKQEVIKRKREQIKYQKDHDPPLGPSPMSLYNSNLNATLQITRPVELHDRQNTKQPRFLQKRDSISPSSIVRSYQAQKQLVLKAPAAIEITNEYYADQLIREDLNHGYQTLDDKNNLDRQGFEKISTLDIMQMQQYAISSPLQNIPAESITDSKTKHVEKTNSELVAGGQADLPVEIPTKGIEMDDHSESPQIDMQERFSQMKKITETGDDSKCLLDRVVNRISKSSLIEENKTMAPQVMSRQIKANSPAMSRNQEQHLKLLDRDSGKTLNQSQQNRYKVIISETDKTHYMGSGQLKTSELVDLARSPFGSMKNIKAPTGLKSSNSPSQDDLDRNSTIQQLREDPRGANNQKNLNTDFEMDIQVNGPMVKGKNVSQAINVESLMDLEFQEHDQNQEDLWSNISTMLQLHQKDFMSHCTVPALRKQPRTDQEKMQQIIQQRRMSNATQRQLREASINQALLTSKFVILPRLNTKTPTQIHKQTIRIPSPTRQNGNFIPLKPLKQQANSPQNQSSRQQLPYTAQNSPTYMISSPSFGPQKKGPWDLRINGPSRQVLEKVFEKIQKYGRNNDSEEKIVNIMPTREFNKTTQFFKIPTKSNLGTTEWPIQQQKEQPTQQSKQQQKMQIYAPKFLLDGQDVKLYQKAINESLPIHEVSNYLSDDIPNKSKISLSSNHTMPSNDKKGRASNEDIKILLKEKNAQGNEPGAETVMGPPGGNSSQQDTHRKGTDFILCARTRSNLHDFNRETSMSHKVQSDSPNNRRMTFETKHLTSCQSKLKNQLATNQYNEASGNMPIHLNIDDIIEGNQSKKILRNWSRFRKDVCPSQTHETYTHHNMGSPIPSSAYLLKKGQNAQSSNQAEECLLVEEKDSKLSKKI